MQRRKIKKTPSFVAALQALTVQQRLVEKVNQKSPVHVSQLDCDIPELNESEKRLRLVYITVEVFF